MNTNNLGVPNNQQHPTKDKSATPDNQPKTVSFDELIAERLSKEIIELVNKTTLELVFTSTDSDKKTKPKK